MGALAAIREQRTTRLGAELPFGLSAVQFADMTGVTASPHFIHETLNPVGEAASHAGASGRRDAPARRPDDRPDDRPAAAGYHARPDFVGADLRGIRELRPAAGAIIGHERGHSDGAAGRRRLAASRRSMA